MSLLDLPIKNNFRIGLSYIFVLFFFIFVLLYCIILSLFLVPVIQVYTKRSYFSYRLYTPLRKFILLYLCNRFRFCARHTVVFVAWVFSICVISFASSTGLTLSTGIYHFSLLVTQ